MWFKPTGHNSNDGFLYQPYILEHCGHARTVWSTTPAQTSEDVREVKHDELYNGTSHLHSAEPRKRCLGGFLPLHVLQTEMHHVCL